MAENRVVNCQGVTLIELLVLVVIASISLSVVMPSIGAGLTGLRLRGAARGLVGAIIHAREQAIHHQQQYQLEVNEVRKVIAISSALSGIRKEYFLPGSISMRVENERLYQAGAPNEPREQVWSFDVNPDGGMTAAAITLSDGDRSVMVIVDPLTGSAQVREQ